MATRKLSINETYRSLNSVRLGLDPIKDGELLPGKINVSLIVKNGNHEGEIISATGTYNAKNGILSGLSKFFKRGFFDYKEEVEYQIKSTNEVQIEIVNDSNFKSVQDIEKSYKSISERKKLKHIHIEPFRPENLNNWKPKTETDIYMIFGVLEKYTEFKYCCGVTQELLNSLNFKFDKDSQKDEKSKPDCILIYEPTGEYFIGEFKMKSSDFKGNHNKADIDVVVVWIDDEDDKDKLPKYVIDLSTIAKIAAIENLNE